MIFTLRARARKDEEVLSVSLARMLPVWVMEDSPWASELRGFELTGLIRRATRMLRIKGVPPGLVTWEGSLDAASVLFAAA